MSENPNLIHTTGMQAFSNCREHNILRRDCGNCGPALVLCCQSAVIVQVLCQQSLGCFCYKATGYTCSRVVMQSNLNKQLSL